MPISPSYEWEQTEVALEVRVALPGTSRSKSDVFATDCMIKVNSSPYLLLLDLWGEVDDARSAATLTADGVKFRLYKRDPGLWPRLEWDGGDKAAATARRNASIDRAHARLATAQKARLEAKAKEEKAAVDRQIDAERAKRAQLERAKGAELDSERADLAAWQAGLKSTQQQGDESDYESDGEHETSAGGEQEGPEPMPDHPHYYGRGWRESDEQPGASGSSGKPAQGRSSALLSLEEGHEEVEDDDMQADGDGQQDTGAAGSQGDAPAVNGAAAAAAAAARRAAARAREESFVPLPPPRITLQPVKVEFTALEMPGLPAREQREEELRVYKRSIAKDAALLADSADVGDRQPAFLKDKGDALFTQGNYQGAVAAYSRALQLDDSAPPLWSNRAAAHLKLGAWASAEEDAGRALDVMRARESRLEAGSSATPEEAAKWRAALVRALVRRGQARVGLGRPAEALADYEEAAKYDQGRTAALASDIEELRASLVPADAATLRQRGNARFAAGDAAGAEAAFTALLGLPRAAVPEAERVAALSNRAAARLMLGQLSGAGEDCGDGLAVAVGGLVAHCAALLGVDLNRLSLSCTDATATITAAAAAAASGTEPTVKMGGGCESPDASGALSGLSAAASALAAATSGATRGAALAWSSADGALWRWAGGVAGNPIVPAAGAAAAALLHEVEQLENSKGDGSVSGPAACVGPAVEPGTCAAAEQAAAGAGAAAAAPGVRARLLSIARLLARRGAVRGHAKAYTAGASDCRSAAALSTVLGEPSSKVEALLADAARLEAFDRGDGSDVAGSTAGVGKNGAQSSSRTAAAGSSQELDVGGAAAAAAEAAGKVPGSGAGAEAEAGVLGEDDVDD